MKLVKCYVSSFGKLKDFTYDFSDELNVIKENNGWGKSTLATFIKVMFYGLNGSAKRSVEDNERKKYRPWNSTEKFGGYVQFSWGNDEFVLERYFGVKESDDTVKLSSVKTGKTFSNTDNLGKRIFEIDEEGFMSTTYFSQKDFEIKSNASLTAKFNSVCEISDEGAFDDALSKLEQKAKTYKYSGDRGLISDVKREIFSVDEQIERAKRAEDVVQSLREETNNLQVETENLKTQTATLTERVTLAGKAEANALKRQRLSALTTQMQQLSSQMESVKKVLGNKTFSEQQIALAEQDEKQLITASANAKLIEEELMQIESEIPKKSTKTLSKKQILCTSIICSLFLIEGLTTIWFNLIAGVLGLVLFVVSVSLFAVLMIGEKNKKKPDENQSVLDRHKAKLNEYNAIVSDCKTRLDEFLCGCDLQGDIDYGTAINHVKFASEKLVSYEREYLRLQQESSLLKTELSGVPVQEVEDIFSLKNQLTKTQTEYSEKSNLLASKRANLKRYEEFSDSLRELEEKKDALSEKMETYKKEHEILLKTIDFLKMADDNLKTKYRAPLQDSLNKYLSFIDEGANNAKIDIDLHMTIEEKTGHVQTEYYSKGYQNLFEICKRFALTDVLFTGEKPFIILDDPFYNLDDNKLKNSLELIKKLSKEYQIIYFICHESRSI